MIQYIITFSKGTICHTDPQKIGYANHQQNITPPEKLHKKCLETQTEIEFSTQIETLQKSYHLATFQGKSLWEKYLTPIPLSNPKNP